MDVADDAKLPRVIVDDGERVGGGADDVQLCEAQRQAKPLEDVIHRQGVRRAVDQNHQSRKGEQRQKRRVFRHRGELGKVDAAKGQKQRSSGNQQRQCATKQGTHRGQR